MNLLAIWRNPFQCDFNLEADSAPYPQNNGTTTNRYLFLLLLREIKSPRALKREKEKNSHHCSLRPTLPAMPECKRGEGGRRRRRRRRRGRGRGEKKKKVVASICELL